MGDLFSEVASGIVSRINLRTALVILVQPHGPHMQLPRNLQ